MRGIKKAELEIQSQLNNQLIMVHAGGRVYVYMCVRARVFVCVCVGNMGSVHPLFSCTPNSQL